MNPTKIVFFEVPKVEQAVLADFLSGSVFDTSFYEEKLNEENAYLAKDAEVVSVFINSVINKNVIDILPGLKFIATRSTGYDHIDVGYCKNKEIKVSNVPAYGSNTVAEFSFALMLDISRKVSDANRQIRKEATLSVQGATSAKSGKRGRISGWDFSNFRGFDLFGKTLGVVGTGKIGKNVIKIAKGFNMKVIAFDLLPDNKFAEENAFQYVSFNDVLADSDIITLHTPYNKDTHHLINKDNIKLFKKGAYLINTARGELVDTEALILGLKEGIVAGAGLDVLEGERKLKEEIEFLARDNGYADDSKTLLGDRMLMGMPNVIVTPHIAFYTREAVAEILKITAENIKSFILSNPQNLVK